MSYLYIVLHFPKIDDKRSVAMPYGVFADQIADSVDDAQVSFQRAVSILA